MAQTVTLSTTGTATMVVNPVAKATTVILSASINSSVSVVQIEMSLDDPTIVNGPSAVWALLSSATAMSSFSGSSGSALTYTVLSPIAQLRLNSTSMAGSSTVYTLKALQSVTA